MLSPSFVTLANSVTFSNAFASGFSTAKWGCMNTPLKFKVVCKGPSRLAVTMTAWGHPPHTGAWSSCFLTTAVITRVRKTLHPDWMLIGHKPPFHALFPRAAWTPQSRTDPSCFMSLYPQD